MSQDVAVKQVQLTDQELQQLAIQVKAGALAIARICLLLREAGTRLNLDWEPEMSVSEYVDDFSSCIAETTPVNGRFLDRVRDTFCARSNWDPAENEGEIN